MDSHMDNKIAIDEFLNEARKLTARETAIMLFVLRQHDPSIFLTRDNNYFITMMNNIDLDAERLLFLLNNINSILVSEKDLEWVFNSQRISLWFFHHLLNSKAILPSFIVNNFSDYVANLITAFDCSFTINLNKRRVGSFWSTDTIKFDTPYLPHNLDFAYEQKLAFVTNAKKLYNLVSTDYKNTDWIDIKNDDQLHWALDYLNKAGILIKPQLFIARNNGDIFAQICASLDTFDNNHDLNYPYTPSLNKKYFISNMRKAWSQKKFRDKKDIESAQDLLLTRKAKKQLSELSSAYDISSVEVLTNLIDLAYQDIKG